MGAVKIKIVNTDHGVLVSVDGKQAYTTSNPAIIEEGNIKKLFQLMTIENVETEVRFLGDSFKDEVHRKI